MIHIHANAVLRVLDGFTGQPLPPSALRCTVDGMPFRPLAKDGGYYILTGLPPGEHPVTLQAPRYAGECLTVPGGPRETRSVLVTMKPGAGYRFGAAVTWLTLRVKAGKKTPAPGRRVWIAARNPLLELRVAQESLSKGDTGGRLFYPASMKSLSLPREFLLADGEQSEICRLEELEEPCFAAPLAYSHKRGRSMFPAQVYTADEAGEIRAVFREPGAVELLAEGEAKPVSFTLEAGENETDLILKKKK